MTVLRISLVFLVLSLLLPSFANAGGSAYRAYRQAKDSYHLLLHSPRKKRYRDQWTRVIDRFLAVTRNFPRSPRAADALYMAGKTCQGLYRVSRAKRDARRAVALFDALVKKYPHDSLADDALVLGGRIEEEILGDPAQAYRRFAKVVHGYPEGDMIGLARRKVSALARYAPVDHPSLALPVPSREASCAGPANVTAIHCRSTSEGARVVIDLSKKADFISNYLSAAKKKGDSDRIYVDVKDAAAGGNLPVKMAVDQGGVRQIRTGRPNADTVRVVLDLAGTHAYKVFPRADPFRIVVDVAGEGSHRGTNGASPAPSLPPGAHDGIAKILRQNQAKPPLKVKLPPVSGKKRLHLIVVDPGHGGKDPGASGPDGAEEKNVTLKIARDLVRRLRRDLGCKVVLTRHTDVFLPLQERTAIANKDGASLFISIHANASPDPNAHGVATYYLNFSKNEEATAVVARENGTSLRQVGDLERILFDLMANSKINESSRLAAEIENSLIHNLKDHYSHIKSLGVRQGPFYVLLGATMPSVLVETSFISNKRGEARLTNPRYEQCVAAGIADGVRKYAEALNLIAKK